MQMQFLRWRRGWKMHASWLIAVSLTAMAITWLAGCERPVPAGSDGALAPAASAAAGDTPPGQAGERITAIKLPTVMTRHTTYLASLPYSIATKQIGSTLFLSVLNDSTDIEVDFKSYLENYNDSRYQFSNLFDNRANYCKIDLTTLQSKLVTKEEWHQAGPRVELTVGPSLARPSNLRWYVGFRPFADDSVPHLPPPVLEGQPGGPQLIQSALAGCRMSYIYAPTEVIALIGTRSRPFNMDEDVCVEFQVRANNQFHILGLHRLVDTAGLIARDGQWSCMFGFVGNGRHFVYLFEDRLWLVPVPENPYLPKPDAKPEPVPTPAAPSVPDPVPKPEPAPAPAPAAAAAASDIVVNSNSALASGISPGLGDEVFLWYGQTQGRNHTNMLDRQGAALLLQALPAGDRRSGEFK